MTTFELDVPEGFDVMMSFEFADPTGSGGSGGEEEGEPYRALLFVNGWHMGERVANLGYVVCAFLPHGDVSGVPLC